MPFGQLRCEGRRAAPRGGSTAMGTPAGDGGARRPPGGRRGASEASPPAVFDVDHLERQVVGDRQLREDLLRLYSGRLIALGPAVCGTASPGRREAAHALRGASLAIGAFAL